MKTPTWTWKKDRLQKLIFTSISPWTFWNALYLILPLPLFHVNFTNKSCWTWSQNVSMIFLFCIAMIFFLLQISADSHIYHPKGTWKTLSTVCVLSAAARGPMGWIQTSAFPPETKDLPFVYRIQVTKPAAASLLPNYALPPCLFFWPTTLSFLFPEIQNLILKCPKWHLLVCYWWVQLPGPPNAITTHVQVNFSLLQWNT